MGIVLVLVGAFAAIYYGRWLAKFLGGYFYQLSYMKKLPGPKSIPFIGSVMDVQGDTTVPLKFWLKSAEEARAKGEGIFTLTLLGRSMIFPINGDMAKAIWESPEEIHKGKDYDFLRPWHGDDLLMAVGRRWKARRRQYTPLFYFTMLEGYLETFNKHARVMTEVLGAQAGQVVDMGECVKRISLDVICDTAMAINFDTQHNITHPYLNAVHVFTQLEQRYITEPHMWITAIWYLFYQREYKQALDKLNSLTDDIMRARFKRVENGEVDLNAKKMPLIDQFFALHQKGDGDWTLEDVHYELNGVIFGGHDTTSSTLTWIYWALGTQPDLQQQCYEEINAIFGDSDRDLTHEDMKAMEFTERFIKESMRIFPPIPTVERELQKDFQMGPYLLPKGADIFMSPHIVHHNPEVYPDPWKFDPDRFLPENVAKRNPYDYVPFSAGPRNCLGQKFAMHEMKTILAWTLRKFSFSTDKKLLDQGFAIEVITKPTLPVALLVTARK